MTDNNAQNLSRAFDLIEADQLSEARIILEPLLAQDVDNADAWWLYAHAVEDRDRARDALNNVLRIDPDYAGAQELLRATEGQSGQGIAPLPKPQRGDDAPIDIDSLLNDDDDEFPDFDDADDFAFAKPTDTGKDQDDDELDDFDLYDDDDRERNPRQMLYRLLAILALVLVLLLVFIVINPFGGDDDDESEATNTPQAVAGVEETDEPNLETEEPVVFDTLEPTEAITEEPTADVQAQSTNNNFDALLDALSTNLDVVDDSATMRSTSFGNTLFVSVCTALGDTLRGDLDQAMRTYADEIDAVTDDTVDAVGVTFVNCDTDSTLNEIAVPRTAITEFANGNTEFEAYRATWQVVD